MASSSSANGRFRPRRRVMLVRQPSREEEYDGPKMLRHHGFIAPRWTAWTDYNPGRRFYGCRDYLQDGGCGYFVWHDGEFGERAKVVVKELLDDIDNLYDENAQLRRGNDGGMFCQELQAIYTELRKVKARYEKRQIELKRWERKCKVVFTALIMTWVWLAWRFLI